MVHNIRFYFSQAFLSLKKNRNLVVGITLSISIILGVFNYVTSVNQYNFNNSLYDLHDFVIQPENSAPNLNISKRFGGNEDSILEEIENINIAKLENFVLYTQIYPDSPDSLRFTSFNQSQVMFHHFESVYYLSDRFKSFFTLLEGRFPNQENEYIIDKKIANDLNLKLDKNETLSFTATNNYGNQSIDYELNHIKIVGFFNPSYSLYSIGNADRYVTKCPLLGILDKKSTAQHPIIDFMQSINTDFHNLFNISFDYYTNYGIGVDINRNKLKINPVIPLDQKINSIYQKIAIISQVYTYIEVKNLIGTRIEFFQSQNLPTQWNFLLLTLPILLFTISLSNFVILSNFKSRFQEFSRYKTKGFTNQMFIKQILIEAFVNALIAFVLSIFFSLGVFFLLQVLLNSFYTQLTNFSNYIPLTIQPVNLLFALLIALIISILGSLATLIKLNRIKMVDIRETNRKLELDFGYDENIFDSADKSKNLDKRYLDQVHLQEKSIPKLSKYCIIGGILPLIFIVIDFLAKSPLIFKNFSIDRLNITIISQISILLATLSPFLLLYGILRYFVIESPKRFAKICKWLSKPFLKRHDYLNALEILRKKPYVMILSILSIFTTSLVFGNITRYTLVRNNQFEPNFHTISDINITVNASSQYGDLIINRDSIDTFTTAIKQLESDQGNLLINEVSHIRLHDFNYLNEQYNNPTVFFASIDLNTYLPSFNPEITQFYPNLSPKIRELQNHNSRETIPGIFVNSIFMEYTNTEVGDIVDFQVPWTFPSINNGTPTSKIQLQIIDILDFIPGVPDYSIAPEYERSFQYFTINSMEQRKEEMIALIDSSTLYSNLTQYLVKSFSTLINLNENFSNSSSNLDLAIKNLTNSIEVLEDASFRYFNHDWNTLSFRNTEFDQNIKINLLYMNLFIIGVSLTFAISNTIINLEKKSLHFKGVLLSRGFGKNRIFRMIISQITILFFFSTILGLTTGIFTGWIWMRGRLASLIQYAWNGVNIAPLLHFPIFMNPIEILLVLGGNFAFSLLLYTGFFLIQERNSISQLLAKF